MNTSHRLELTHNYSCPITGLPTPYYGILVDKHWGRDIDMFIILPRLSQCARFSVDPYTEYGITEEEAQLIEQGNQRLFEQRMLRYHALISTETDYSRLIVEQGEADDRFWAEVDARLSPEALAALNRANHDAAPIECRANALRALGIEPPPESVFAYFRRLLGEPLNRAPLSAMEADPSWMPIDSNCGKDCKEAIDAAATLLRCARNAGGSRILNYERKVIELTRETCETFIYG